MTTRTWPTDRLFVPQRFSWGMVERIGQSESVYTGAIQTGEVPFAMRYKAVVEFAPTESFAEQQQRIGFLMSCSRRHRVRFHNFTHMAPAGTMRASPTVYGSYAQGWTSIQIATTSGYTLLPGDLFGVTTSTGFQVLTVVTGGTAAGGILIVEFAQPLRGTVTNGALITWDKPAPTFLLSNPEWLASFRPREAEVLVAEFVEVW